jgi:hypothetical protein
MTRAIKDRSFWAGGPQEGNAVPVGTRAKMESSAEGAGHLSDYPDTSEDIKKGQMAAVGKIKANPIKPGYRN